MHKDWLRLIPGRKLLGRKVCVDIQHVCTSPRRQKSWALRGSRCTTVIAAPCTVALCKYVRLMSMRSFKGSLWNKTGLVLCVSHPIMSHIAFIQGPVAMAAPASIAWDVDASFFPNSCHTQVTFVTTPQNMTHSPPSTSNPPLKYEHFMNSTLSED